MASGALEHLVVVSGLRINAKSGVIPMAVKLPIYMDNAATTRSAP